MATNTISDDELRNRLQDLGQNVGPVTPTTRPLLLRKLKKLQKEGAGSAKGAKKDTRRKSAPSTPKKRQTPSRKLVGFSSDEDDDQSKSRTKRRVSSGRFVRVKEEADNSKDDIDASRDDFERPQSKFGSNRGNSAVNSFNDASNNRDEFSDSDSTAYTGPFQRGGFRFRSFRRKKDSPETKKIHRPRFQDIAYSADEMQSDDMANDQDTTDGAYRPNLKTNLLSSFLNIVAFFVLVVCVGLLVGYYLNVFDVDKYGITSSRGSLPFCIEGHKNKYCLDKDEVKEKYVYYLIDLLSKQAGHFDCGNDSKSSRNISREELIKKLDSKLASDNPAWSNAERNQVKTDVLELLTKLRPEDSGIRLYDKDSKPITNNTEIVHWYESIRPYKSLVCRIQQSFSKVMMGIFALLCVFLVLIGVYYGVRNHWRKEEEDTRMMYKFVENIIDILRKHHDACKTDKDLPPYLPIPHVRDMLIKPAERKTMANVWSKAVRFLSANESRIRVESQRIAGEDFEVWRWIHIMSPKHHSHKVSLQDTKKPKYWQGQAFENFQWAVNPPVISPTPCLKIRNMFDPDVELDECWHVIIQDAILEKSIDAGANIVHIAVDKSSSEGCVYVKCDSHASAGVAFKSLHGSWFDGRLVAVKYLTLRRYHQRFPKSLTATGSLKPSGTSPSSLVTLDPEEEMDVNDSETEV